MAMTRGSAADSAGRLKLYAVTSPTVQAAYPRLVPVAVGFAGAAECRSPLHLRPVPMQYPATESDCGVSCGPEVSHHRSGCWMFLRPVAVAFEGDMGRPVGREGGRDLVHLAPPAGDRSVGTWQTTAGLTATSQGGTVARKRPTVSSRGIWKQDSWGRSHSDSKL